MAGKKGPWGSGPKGGDGGPDGGDAGAKPEGSGDPAPEEGAPPEEQPKGPRNPWQQGGGEPRRSANIEDIFRKRGPEGPRRGPGGPNFRMPPAPGGRGWLPLALGGVALLWLGLSMVHQIEQNEQGIVTIAGKYSRKISPGISLTLPWPLEAVDVEQVTSIRKFAIPEDETEKLMLTSDQNLVNLSYQVRWHISDLTQFRFQLQQPEDTLREVAEAAMRASVAELPLNVVFSGGGRADIELRVRERMQKVLDAYRSGIAIEGVDVLKTDPPVKVIDAFKNVSAAQQEAKTYVNDANKWAQQVLAQAEGSAAAFDKVYEQYRLAPEVTRRRMYYETMERVLRQNDKAIIESSGVTSYLPLPEIKRRADQKQAGGGQ